MPLTSCWQKHFNAHMHTRAGHKHSLGRWGWEEEGAANIAIIVTVHEGQKKYTHARREKNAKQPSRTELKHMCMPQELKKKTSQHDSLADRRWQ